MIEPSSARSAVLALAGSLPPTMVDAAMPNAARSGGGEAEAAPVAAGGDDGRGLGDGVEVLLDVGHQFVLQLGEPARGEVSLLGDVVISHCSSSTFRETRSSLVLSVSTRS